MYKWKVGNWLEIMSTVVLEQGRSIGWVRKSLKILFCIILLVIGGGVSRSFEWALGH